MSSVEKAVETREEKTLRLMAECREFSTDELWRSLKEDLALSAESFWRAAVKLRILEERGDIEAEASLGGMREVLRKIAYGTLIPELLVFCGPKYRLFTEAQKLVPPDQERLVREGFVDFAEGDSVRRLDPRTATAGQLDQIFDGENLRQPHAQRRWLAEQASRVKRSKAAIMVEQEDIFDREALTSTTTVAIKPEWKLAIEHMARENGDAKNVAALKFLMSLGKNRA